MRAADIIKQIEALPAEEQAQVRDWLEAREITETPEMLAALDAAARSADRRGTTPVTEVRKMLSRWTSKSA